jgi:biopolymer transport protein ExbB
MFLSADILVKAVMLGLTFASLVTWTIFLAKSTQLFLAKRGQRSALARLADTKTLTEAQLAAGRKSEPASLLAAAVQEIRLSVEGAASGIQARAAPRFAEIVRAEGRSARSGLGIVAMIAPTAPSSACSAPYGES